MSIKIYAEESLYSHQEHEQIKGLQIRVMYIVSDCLKAYINNVNCVLGVVFKTFKWVRLTIQLIFQHRFIGYILCLWKSLAPHTKILPTI